MSRGDLPWFRMYHSLPFDEKALPLGATGCWLYVVLLCLAARSDRRGWVMVTETIGLTADQIGRIAQIDNASGEVDELLALMERMEMIARDEHGVIEILHWNERQHDKPSDAPEAVRERVRRHRSQQPNTTVTPCNAGETPMQRSSNALEERRGDTDTEGEKKGLAPSSGAAHQPPPARRTPPPKPKPQRPPGCSWCTTPTAWESDAPPVQRLMQVYHDAFRGRFSECPIVTESDWAALKRLIGAGKSPPDIRDVIRHALASEDGRMIDGGFKPRQIAAEYQAIKIAFAKGVPYGIARFNSRPAQPTARRPAVSDPGSFGETGAASWD